MSQALPTHGFRWLNRDEIDEQFPISETGCLALESLQSNMEDGYVFEVDLDYPAHLHNNHSEYPLAPEKMTITPEMLSPIQLSMLIDIKRQCLIATKKNFIGPLPKPDSCASVKKLVPNLQPKKSYIAHHQNLQLHQQLGLQITKIHRVITFKQSKWLKRYPGHLYLVS